MYVVDNDMVINESRIETLEIKKMHPAVKRLPLHNITTLILHKGVKIGNLICKMQLYSLTFYEFDPWFLNSLLERSLEELTCTNPEFNFSFMHWILALPLRKLHINIHTEWLKYFATTSIEQLWLGDTLEHRTMNHRNYFRAKTLQKQKSQIILEVLPTDLATVVVNFV